MELNIGSRFGKLEIIRLFSGPRGGKMCECLCDCGKTREFNVHLLIAGMHKSCGCLLWKHGLTTKEGRLFSVWVSMKSRCNNPHSTSYKDYGGRGISYDKQWQEFGSFFDDMASGYSEGLSLDRIDNDGNYSKENCRWATKIEQANNKRSNVKVEHQGQLYTVAELARKYNVPYAQFRVNLKKGWPVEKALCYSEERKSQAHKKFHSQ